MRYCQRTLLTLLLIVLGLGGFILLIVLPAITVNKRVEQNEVGIFVNSFTTDVVGPYEQGSYTINVGDSIILFTRIVQDSGLEDIICLSNDKITIDLNVFIQFQYN